MDITEDDDIHGMDYGDYLEGVNVILKSMVDLEQREGITYTSNYLAQRFDEPMLTEIVGMLQRVQTILSLANAPGVQAANKPPVTDPEYLRHGRRREARQRLRPSR